MRVQIELSSTQDISGMKNITAQWESQFPAGRLVGISAYGTLSIQLEMPVATQVIVPQITDASGHVED